MNDAQRFDKHAKLYAIARPHYPESLFSFLENLTPEHERAWDCATGNGQAASSLARYYKQVEATDISEAQIQSAISAASNIHFSVQSAESTSFRDRSFDLICVAQALHWFDLEQFWPEVQRLLKIRGVFAAIAYGWSSVSPEIDAVVESELKAIIAPYWSLRNRHCQDGYTQISFPFEPIDCPSFELRVHWSINQYFQYLCSWSATQIAVRELGHTFLDYAKAEINKVWQQERYVVQTPLTLICGSAW